MKLCEEKDMIALFFRHSQFSVMYKMKFDKADRKIIYKHLLAIY